MFKKLVVFVFVLSFLQLSAQNKRGNIWYFGSNAGLDFNSGNPVPLTNGKINTNEGCAVVSDCDGNLEFYTDGVSVWNRNHAVMTNGTGLKGNWTTTQSAIVVPKPGDPNTYFIFTADELNGTNGINYTVVDMTLSGGLGSVTTKNVQLIKPATEKLSGVKHANGTDFWVIAHGRSNNTYYSYLVNSSGVSLAPVVSNAGTVYPFPADDPGYMRANPTGTKIAAALQTSFKVDVVDFDNNTGAISGGYTIPPAISNYVYGLEFSPDGTKLYVGYETAKQIYQYDLSAGSTANIISSQTLIGTTTAQEFGAIQNGPDGKIYVALYNSTTLGVINNPNIAGVSCDYVDKAIWMGGKVEYLGLPNFVESFFEKTKPITASISGYSGPHCPGSADGVIVASATGGTGVYTYTWSNGANGQIASGLVAGNYSVTITGPSGNTDPCDATGGTTSNVTTFSISDPAPMAASTDVSPSSCGFSNGSAWVSAVSNGTPGYNYSWSNGANGLTSQNLLNGTYTVTITDANNCVTTKTAFVWTTPLPVAQSVSKNTTCGNSNGSIDLIVTGGAMPVIDYSWSNGSKAPSQSNLSAGTYTVSVMDSWGCIAVTTAAVGNSAPISISVSAKTNVNCAGQSTGSVGLSASGGSGVFNYLWNSGSSSPVQTNLAAGNYTVTVTDGGTCIATSVVAISQPGTSPAGTVNTTQTGCTTNTGTATVNAAGGSPGYSYLWSSGSALQTANNLGVGVYSVTITDSKGCTAITQAAITVANGPAVGIFSSANVSCFGSSTGTAFAQGSGGLSPYTYNWSNGVNVVTSAGTHQINNLTAGTYSVTLTDANGCSGVTAVAITQPALNLSVSGSNSTDALCFGSNTGTGVAFANGGTPGYTFSWSNGASGANVSNLAAGNYFVTVTDNNGCISTNAVSISQPAQLSPVVSALSNVNCFGTNTGSATVTSVNGGTPGFQYSWSSGSKNSTATNLSSGIYTVTVTDNNNCSKTAAVSISQPSAALTTTISSQTNVSCNGGNNGSIQVSANGGTGTYTYNWSTGLNTTTSGPSQVNNLSTGVYVVTVADANGCTALTSVTINQPAVALAGAVSTSANVLCYGGNTGSAVVQGNAGTPGYSYTWSNGVSGATATNLVKGNYAVTVTDSKGCTTIVYPAINEPTALALNTNTANVKCFAGNSGTASVSVNGGTAGYAYSWSNGIQTATAVNLASGTYSVTVTDNNGCVISTSVALTQPAKLSPVVNVSNNVNCYGTGTGSAVVTTVNGGTPGFVYNWSNGSGSATATNLSSGTYTVTVTDANSCSETGSVTVSQPGAALVANVGTQTNVTCKNAGNGGVALTTSGGTGVYTYNWSNGSTTSSISNLLPGPYSVTISDSKGCTTITNAVISEPTQLVATTTSASVNCFSNSTGAASVSSVGGGTPGYSYTWSNGASASSTANLAAGNYVVTVTDNNGCTITVGVLVSQPSAPLQVSATSQTNVNCFGTGSGSASVNGIGGTAGYTYNWSNSATTGTASNLTAGTYTVTVTDAAGCQSTSSVSIVQPFASLSNNVVTTNTACGISNGSVSLSPAGGTATYAFNWSNGGSGQSATGLAAGTYTITITDVKGCTLVSTVNVNASQGPTVNSTAQNATCKDNTDGSVTTNASGGTAPYTYTWSQGSTANALSNVPLGNYAVTVTDAGGCTSTTSVSVQSANPQPAVDYNYTPNEIIYTGSEVDFTDLSSGGSGLSWNFGDTASAANNSSVLSNPIHIFKEVSTYCVTLTVTSAAGCIDKTVKCLNVIDRDSIFVPNVFTPNGDGVNDVFIITATGMQELNFDIYDRWGLKIYDGALPKAEWDGRTLSGVLAADGTYYYTYTALSLRGKKYSGAGFVTLLKAMK